MTRRSAVVGKVLYLAPGAKQWVEVAGDFNYANGIGISPDQKTLYVCETVGNSIKKFTIKPDGTLSHRANFALLNLLVKNKVECWWLGPDSLKVDQQGNVYVAQFSGRQGPEDLAAGQAPARVRHRRGRWHDQRRLRSGREESLRHRGARIRATRRPRAASSRSRTSPKSVADGGICLRPQRLAWSPQRESGA